MAYFKIEDVNGLSLAIEGAAGLLMYLACNETSNADKPAAHYTAPAFGLLAEITSAAGAYLRDNELAITEAIEKGAR